MIKFSRIWSMPNADTFSIKPIRELVKKYLVSPSVDPFARNDLLADYTNDLNPDTQAKYHMDAIEFLDLLLKDKGENWVKCALLDPPYSPRQVKECYNSIGMKPTMQDTQTGRLYKNCKDRLAKLIESDGIAITCGWNSMGLGKNRGFKIIEILLVPCGGAHNDYIITVEKKIKEPFGKKK